MVAANSTQLIPRQGAVWQTVTLKNKTEKYMFIEGKKT